MASGNRIGLRDRLKAGIAAAAFLSAAVCVGVGTKVRSDFLNLEPVPADLSLSVVVLDRADRLLRAFTSTDDKWRLPVAAKDIDPLYVDLLLAFEDQRFRAHGGVDARAFARAAFQSLVAGRIVSGGSTLSMQAARLLDERPTRSLARKYWQVLKAWQMERDLGKDGILSFYAHRAPFGGNLEGVRAASLVWFGKEPTRLTPAEAALLVALPQSPEARRPDRKPEAARIARNRVLARGEAAGILTADEARSAMQEPIGAERHAMPFLAPHETREAVLADRGGPVVRLTLDRDLQSVLEDLARTRVAALPEPVSIALMAADHQTGEILASIGSPNLLDDRRLGHVDMTRAVRSPGSTLKPYIYGLAFEEGIGHPESLIDDRPTTIGGYRPTNFDEAYQGTVTLREALQLSLNTPAVQLLEAVGPARLVARLKRAGVVPVLSGDKAAGLAIGLGGIGVTMRDLVQAYAALARQGRPVALVSCRETCPPPPEAGKVPVLSDMAAWQVGDILQGMPQAQAAGDRKLAYKTGTAYGYRDAWAVGYDGRHVVAIWVGRPDGSPVPGQTGAKTAVPLLFDVFDRLGAKRERLPDAPMSNRPAVGQSKAPRALAWARVTHRAVSGGPESSRPLSIRYPPQGATIDLGAATPDTAAPLVVKLDGGRGPYTFLLNGIPVPRSGSDTLLSAALQREGRIPVIQSGFAEITVVDGDGRSARVDVTIR